MKGIKIMQQHLWFGYLSMLSNFHLTDEDI